METSCVEIYQAGMTQIYMRLVNTEISAAK